MVVDKTNDTPDLYLLKSQILSGKNEKNFFLLESGRNL
jgi:hypothetical protein